MLKVVWGRAHLVCVHVCVLVQTKFPTLGVSNIWPVSRICLTELLAGHRKLGDVIFCRIWGPWPPVGIPVWCRRVSQSWCASHFTCHHCCGPTLSASSATTPCRSHRVPCAGVAAATIACGIQWWWQLQQWGTAEAGAVLHARATATSACPELELLCPGLDAPHMKAWSPDVAWGMSLTPLPFRMNLEP